MYESFGDAALDDYAVPSEHVVGADSIPEIDPGFYDVLPWLSDEEYAALKESIRVHGVQVPAEIDGLTGGVIDGRARVQICGELGITDYPVIVRLGLTPDEAREHALRLNCQRRQLSQQQRGELIDAELIRDPSRSDRVIADLCGCTTPTVRRHRKQLESDGVIPVVDYVISRDGQMQPAQKPRKPAIMVSTADDVAATLEHASLVEPCDLSGGLHTAAEIAKHVRHQTHVREQRETQIENRTDDDSWDGDDDGIDVDNVPTETTPDPGHIDLMLADATLAECPTYAGLAETAASALKWGCPLAVRVPTAEIAEAMRVLGERLEYTHLFVETLSEAEPVALPIPVEQRHRVTLFFRQPCPPGKKSHKQALVTDVFNADGEHDPLEIVKTLVSAYTYPGDRVLDVQGRDGVAAACDDLGRSYTTDPETPDDWDPKSPHHKRPIEKPSHIWPPLHRGDQATQLTALMESDDIVAILRGDRRIALQPVEYGPLSRILKRDGNTKVAAGVLNAIRDMCCRAALPYDGCGVPCYSVPGACRGCYGNLTRHAMHYDNWAVDYDLVHNRLINDRGKIILPNRDDWSLSKTPPFCDPHVWRVCSETAPGDMAIALGIMQRFAAATPDQWFYTFVSHGFRPDDEALASLASLPNCWCIHTLSGWMSPTELDMRFESFARYMDAGIPSIAYVVTSSLWDNDTVARRALKLVGEPEFFIEEPLRIHNNKQGQPVLGVNPLGRCSQAECAECPLKCGFVPLLAGGLLRAPQPAIGTAITGPWAAESEMIRNVAV